MASYRIIKRWLPGSNVVQLIEYEGALRIWRPASGHRGRGRVDYEVAAYCVDAALGLDVVPRAWQITLDGEPGVMQEFVDGVDGYSWDSQTSQAIHARKDYIRMRLLDWIIGNPDRYDWHVIHDPGTDRLWSVDHTNVFHYDEGPRERPSVTVMAKSTADRLLLSIAPFVPPQETAECMNRVRALGVA
jgi:hypothetical protein